jgi:ferrous iron transport protein A
MPSLDQLNVGETGVVEAVEGAAGLVQRLLEMGLLEGEPVTVLAVAPLGDPLEIELRDYRLSLRRAEAACVRVRQPG